jgi:hypothetical protein
MQLARFLIALFGTLLLLLAATAAIVVPARRAASEEQLRFFVPQSDPLFQAAAYESIFSDSRVIVLGSSRAETGFNPAYYRTLSGAGALNLGMAGTNLAGSSPTVGYLAERWAPLHSAPAGEVLVITSEDELTYVEQDLGRYACAGAGCFSLWEGAPPQATLKQQAAWVDRAARLAIGWDLRALSQAMLVRLGRGRATWTAERCAEFVDTLSAERAKEVPVLANCARGFVLTPVVPPAKAAVAAAAQSWAETRAEPMSGLNVLARQAAVLRAAGARMTVLLFDTIDRPIAEPTLGLIGRSLAGVRLCHFRPGPDGYYDAQHLSVLSGARITRWYASGDDSVLSGTGADISCTGG